MLRSLAAGSATSSHALRHAASGVPKRFNGVARATATGPILICKEKIDNEIVCRRAAPDFPAAFPFQCLSICQKQLQKWADRLSGSSRFFS